MKTLLVWILLPAAAALCQTQATPGEPAGPNAQQDQKLQAFRPTYRLGPDDQIMIKALDAEEISDKPYRIDVEGYVTLPLLGRLKVGGLTVEESEKFLVQKLAALVRNPQVVVTVVQFRSEPVFVVGAFRNPGIYALQGKKTLIELLTSVGGLQPNASRRLKLSRRLEQGEIPLAGAAVNSELQVSTAEINLNNLMETVNPAEDLELKPFDVIKAGTAGVVFAGGEVTKAGAIELQDREYLPVTSVISISGGLTRDAVPSKAVVLRPVLDTSRRASIPIDLEAILAGKANDFPLLPNDMLVVPRNRGKFSAFGKAMLLVLPSAATAGIIAALQ